MKYKQICQCSRPYQYGETKEFKTEEDALDKVTKLKQEIEKSLKLNKLYDISEVKIISCKNAFQIIVTLNIPIFVEEK